MPRCRATYFAHRAKAQGGQRHAELDAAILASFTQAKGRYGHRRIHRELRAAGRTVAKKTVLHRMRALGLCCQVRRKKRVVGGWGTQGSTAPNRLNRCFRASAPNQKWVTDVTEFRIGPETLYLSPIMDLCDRQIIAYTMGRSPNLGLAVTALRTALATLGPDDHPLVHSDQGLLYRHRTWQELLATVGATQSMSRRGNCLDNAVMESFFGHLKSELAVHQFATITDLEHGIADYLHWYNQERTSATLNGLSPVQYRAQLTLG
ncbi:MAG: IS3 family transposase [Thermomicrobiales bacterium]|nr:IS3 family transposase [Thermomicrobiales bacterium]